MSKSNFLLLATVLASLSVSAFAEPVIAEPVMQKPLFVKGVGGYNIYRIPALLTTQAGILLAFCEGREAGDSSDIDLLLRRSEDGGETWSRKQVVWDQGKNVCGNPCPVQDRDTGIIWLLLTWNSSSDSGGALHKGTGKDTRRVYVCSSKDDGLTWSEPVEITETTKKKNWWWYATGPGVGIQLEQGPHKGRLVIPCDHTSKDGHGSHVIYSDDHGGTWQLGGSVEGGGANECQVVELADGTLILNMRIQKGSQRKRGIATSRDGGETWSELELDPALIEPVCQASFLRYSPASSKGKNRLLFSNPASTGDRVNMTVRISYDEGKTWPVTKQLYPGYSAYSCLTVLPDGDIGCFYEAGETKDAAIYFARFPLAWLEVSPAGAPGRDRYLLLDSRIIDTTENAELTLGTVKKDPRNPLFMEDKPWEPRYDNVYANVIFDKQDRLYKCWYSPFIIDERTTSTPEDKRNPYDSPDHMKIKPRHREMGVCYAVSKDGIHWEKPELGLIEFEGSKKNNIVMRGKEMKGVFFGPHGAGVFKDSHEADPAKRYKMILRAERMAVSYSADGLRWCDPIPCPEIRAAGDTHNNAFWDPYNKRYMGYVRTWRERGDGGDGERVVGFTQSADFENWTGARNVLRDYDRDAQNPDGDAQTHDMIVFPTGGVYIGLLGAMYFPEINSEHHVRQHVELAWSPDGEKWFRIQEGMPFIENTPAAKEYYGKMPYDWGTIFASAPIFFENETRIYYGACDWYFFDWRKGYLALATIRPDGWAGYEPVAANQPARIKTTPVVCTGKDLRVCADVEKNGYVKIKLLDSDNKPLAEGELIAKTVTDGPIQWKDGFSFKKLKGKEIKLRFELRESKLYSFSFESLEREEQSNSHGFVSIFNGKTIEGWHAAPIESGSDWTVRDGAIVGHGSADRLSYLVWKDEDLTDFELELRYRLPNSGNTGVEIRSQPDPTGKRPFVGYHADLGHAGIGSDILGAWDFHFAGRKEPPCPRGTKLVIDAAGTPHSSTIRRTLTVADIRPQQWNDVRIIARGNHFQFFINGKLASEFTDNAKHGRLEQGAIGLQIHDKGMQVEFKDIRLKRLAFEPEPEEYVSADVPARTR